MVPKLHGLCIASKLCHGQALGVELSLRAKLPIFHRATKPQWDRIPSDIWYRVEGYLIPVAMIVQVPFFFAFLGAWNFHFPSRSEQVMWRAASVFHASYSSLGTAYYFFTLVPKTANRSQKNMISVPLTATSAWTRHPAAKAPRSWLEQCAESMRNLSLDKDPDMAMSLRWTMGIFFPTVLYIFCRLYFYVEDVVSLRSQPANVYAPINSLFRIFTIG